ncbi:hypothetical protein [Flavobacterium sp.]|uniref:hypothetical protein n=1 Tax=Flavobacterium sp. TaxID=239 RepID=UPI0026105591|nr:hypothetical protein [Flavobacterium sp.]
MKNLILFLLFSIALTCCQKDDDQTISPINQLPPITQTGANTFGCLLDEQVFKPGNGPNPLDCVYQFVNGGYYFTLQANKYYADADKLIGVGCVTQKLQITQGQTYILQNQSDGNASGGYFFNVDWFYTSVTYTGELKIIKLDEVNHIVSGTFWYDVQDTNGVVHKIREGRFDMQYTN